MLPGARKTKDKKTRLSRGRMEPFPREVLQLIRLTLKAEGAVRDRALLEVAMNSMLRCGDVLRIRVSDLRDHQDGIREGFVIQQMKTRKSITVILTPKAREAVRDLIASEDKLLDDYLFTRQRQPHGNHLSEVAYRQIIKRWARIANLDPRHFSGHSTRRTKASAIYRETRNAEAVRQLLGHTSLAHTIVYLGVEAREVQDLARRFDI